MPVITLTTEWQAFDYYNGILKGKLASMCPGIPVIENANGLSPFNIQKSAFVIRNTFEHYPEGSVHIICVQSEYSDSSPHVIVEARGHFFIGADNGIFHLILNSEPDRMVQLSPGKTTGRIDEIRVFAEAADAIIKGGGISGIGVEKQTIREMHPFRATIEEDAITGSIIYIDTYGNAISNITNDLFKRVFDNKSFQIAIRSNKNIIDHISDYYNSESIGELLAVFNSLNLLEIGINGTNAAELLSLQVGDIVRIAAPGSSKKPGMLF
ncbi:MAG: SAM-dependent chlorinase/fluorinase [Bacteroidales bacterium]|nr:SAM-dependent chlorinase/fluorinase [Bacteroidales bacterium]